MHTTAAFLTGTALALAFLGPAASGHTPHDTVGERAAAPVIVVDAGKRGPAASRQILGVNHHYNRDGYGLWDPRADAPEPEVVEGSVRAGVSSLRFPGGTIANLYDWKRAVVEPRPCQVSGNGTAEEGYPPVRSGLAWGPDEYVEFLDATGARPFIMVPFVTETPGDAADWVEYMNTPAGDGVNPNGGVDWAAVRAEGGHQKPYGVRRWEIGNEQDHGASRYWMSADERVAVRQYAFGGERFVRGERLGKDCDHSVAGVASDGGDDQVFEVLYPPVRTSSVKVTVDGAPWQRVDDLSGHGPTEHVYVVAGRPGSVRFGDGVHGAVPPAGAVVRATYVSVHEGFFAFAQRMKKVDPSIDVCASWGTELFVTVAGSRRYDCLTTHRITTFAPNKGEARWDSALHGHDLFVTTADRKVGTTRQMLRLMRGRAPLWITEFSTIRGDRETFPSWATSMSHALHMATLWGGFLRLGVPWAMGDDLLWGSDRAVLGPSPDYTFTADAVSREALVPMFGGGGRVVASTVHDNPSRGSSAGDYAALSVTATTSPGGPLYLLVVNRLPFDAVSSRLRINGFATDGTAQVRTVDSGHFTDWNQPDAAPDVTLQVTRREVDAAFRHTFPAASITVLVLGRR